MFVYEPALLMIGDWQTILLSTTTATIGCVALAAPFGLASGCRRRPAMRNIGRPVGG